MPAPIARVETFAVGPLGCNCSLVIDDDSGQAVVIDPGGDAPSIHRRLEKAGASLVAILLTHAHIDHLAGSGPLQSLVAQGLSARLHEADGFLCELLHTQAALMQIPEPEVGDLDLDLADGEIVTVGQLALEVLHTPGHSPGSVSFVLATAAGQMVFTGDTLYRRDIGRTDMWRSDADLLVRSIRERLFTLDDTTAVITGHGPPTTIGEERACNPFAA